jgi:hypothetical protein
VRFSSSLSPFPNLIGLNKLSPYNQGKGSFLSHWKFSERTNHTSQREGSIFDDIRNFSKKQGLTISLPKQNPERADSERIILRFAEARGFLR